MSGRQRPRERVAAQWSGRASTPDSALPPERSFTSRSGTRWRATVVARLVSEDSITGAERAQLVIRVDCLARPRHAARIFTLRASNLDELQHETLCALAADSPSNFMRKPRAS